MRLIQDPTIEQVLQRIADRLSVLGNKTRSNKARPKDKTRAAHGTVELVNLQNWIKNGGSNHDHT